MRFRPAAAVSVVRGVWNDPANRGHRLAALWTMARFQLRGRLRGRPTVVPYARSSRIEARLDDGSSRRAAYSRLPDHLEMEVWQEHLRPGDLFVDVGANVGLYSVLALEAGCRVVAVEPNPSAAEQLRHNVELNGGADDLELVMAALAERSGQARLAGADSSRQHLVDDPSGLGVPVTTLDELLADRTARGVKIDVEGAERRVLEGARDALAGQRIELLQIEWNDQSMVNYSEGRDRIVELLDAAGYQILRPVGGRLLPTDPSIGSDVFARPVN